MTVQADNSKHILRRMNLKETVGISFVGMSINLGKDYSQYL